MVRGSVVGFLFFLLLLPYFILVSKVDLSNIDLRNLSTPFFNSITQSVLSCFFTIICGLAGALGLLSVKKDKQKNIIEALSLATSFLPPLFMASSVMLIVRPFPFGLTGIVLLHVITYSGLTALIFKFLFQEKFHKLSEIALIEGANQRQFLWACIKNMPAEFFMIFLFLFVQFFTSFSIPLLAGHQYLTLETLIYDKIKNSAAISDALMISFLESVFIGLILIFYNFKNSIDSSHSNKVHLLGSKIGIVIILAPVLIFSAGSIWGASVALVQFSNLNILNEDLFIKSIRSVSLSLAVGLTLFAILSAVSFSYPSKFFDRFLSSYIPLSTVLIALSLVVFNLNLGIFEVDLKFILAIVILSLPVLYRFKLKSKLDSLVNQIEVAELMGGNHFFIFKKIIFPQVRPTLLFLSGLGAFWAIGDFAVSQIIFGSDVTLALYIQGLVGSYRLELANLMTVALLVIGILIFTFFKELNYVFDRKN